MSTVFMWKGPNWGPLGPCAAGALDFSKDFTKYLLSTFQKILLRTLRRILLAVLLRAFLQRILINVS